jgi:hypothetical protein
MVATLVEVGEKVAAVDGVAETEAVTLDPTGCPVSSNCSPVTVIVLPIPKATEVTKLMVTEFPETTKLKLVGFAHPVAEQLTVAPPPCKVIPAYVMVMEEPVSMAPLVVSLSVTEPKGAELSPSGAEAITEATPNTGLRDCARAGVVTRP